MGSTHVLFRSARAALRSAGVAVPLAAACVAFLAMPASASQVDSWGGQIFLRDPSDVFAYPHRALDYRSTANLVFVPPTSNAGDFTRAPLSNTQVAGVLVLGKGALSGFIGANVPNSFNPVEAYGSGPYRGWGGGLELGPLHYSDLVLGIDSSYSPEVTAKMQLGGAFQATDDLRVGASFQQFGQTWTEEATFGMNPSEKTGFEIGGYNFTASSAVTHFGALQELEGAVSYGTSDQEEWNPIDGIGGDGSANTYSLAFGANFGDLGWLDTRIGLDWRLYGRYDHTKSDFTYEAANDSTPSDKEDSETTSWDVRWGVSHEGDALFGTSAGVRSSTEEENIPGLSGVAIMWKMEEKLMPYCDAGGEIPIGGGFSLDYGMFAAWRDVETTNTVHDVNGDLISRTTEKDANVETSYHAGVAWDPNGNVRLTVTLDTDQLGDPGGALFGNNNDAPGVAIGARYSF